MIAIGLMKNNHIIFIPDVNRRDNKCKDTLPIFSVWKRILAKTCLSQSMTRPHYHERKARLSRNPPLRLVTDNCNSKQNLLTSCQNRDSTPLLFVLTESSQ